MTRCPAHRFVSRSGKQQRTLRGTLTVSRAFPEDVDVVTTQDHYQPTLQHFLLINVSVFEENHDLWISRTIADSDWNYFSGGRPYSFNWGQGSQKGPFETIFYCFCWWQTTVHFGEAFFVMSGQWSKNFQHILWPKITILRRFFCLQVDHFVPSACAYLNWG